MHLDRVYGELCAEVRSTDDVSFRLLWVLLTLAAAGIAISVLEADTVWPSAIYPMAVFGATVSFGLFRWELRNLQICRRAIRAVVELDEAAGSAAGEERKTARRFPGLSAPRILGWPFGKTQAEKLIYSATILLWLSLPGVARVCTEEGRGGASGAPHVGVTTAYLAVAGAIAAMTLLSIASSTEP